MCPTAQQRARRESLDSSMGVRKRGEHDAEEAVCENYMEEGRGGEVGSYVDEELIGEAEEQHYDYGNQTE